MRKQNFPEDAKSKGFRLHLGVCEAFERECKASMLNQTEVVEALFVYFLGTSGEQRKSLAKEKATWIVKNE